MRKITLDWSYPMDINNILYDERMGDIGISNISGTEATCYPKCALPMKNGMDKIYDKKSKS